MQSAPMNDDRSCLHFIESGYISGRSENALNLIGFRNNISSRLQLIGSYN